MAIVPDESRFECPTSGVLLGALVKAFQLDDERVSGPAAKHLGSEPSLGRTARRYFEGTTVPNETRRQICAWVGQAVHYQGLLEGVSLPKDGPRPVPPLDQFVSGLLYEWLTHWDHLYVRAAAGWPHLPRALSGYVIGRQVVIDLVLRTAAVLHIAGHGQPEVVTLCAPAAQPGKALINHLMEHSGRRFTRDALARELFVERSTVDEWIDESSIPKDPNLRRLAEVFARDGSQQTRLLRWLRVQYGVIRLGRRLREAVGDYWAGELLYVFAQLLDWTLEFHSQSKLPKDQFQLFQAITLRHGAAMESNYWVLNGLRKLVALDDQHVKFWGDDLISAQQCEVQARLEACFSIIGDWPKSLARWESTPEWAHLSDEDRRLAHTSAALVFMSPTLHDSAQPTDNDRARDGALPPGKLPTADVQWMAQSAWNLMRSGQHAAALPLLDRLVRDNPADADLQCYYGEALWRAVPDRRFDDAIERLKEAARLRPDWDYPLAEIARVYLHRGWTEHALQVLESAPAGMMDKSPDGSFLLGLALSRLGRMGDALLACERSMALDERHAEAWDLAAECAFRLGDKVRGRRYAKQAAHLGQFVSYQKWLAELAD